MAKVVVERRADSLTVPVRVDGDLEIELAGVVHVRELAVVAITNHLVPFLGHKTGVATFGVLIFVIETQLLYVDRVIGPGRVADPHDKLGVTIPVGTNLWDQFQSSSWEN